MKQSAAGRPMVARWLHWIGRQCERKSRERAVQSLPERARGGFDCLETVEMLLRHHTPVEVLDIGAWRGRWTLALLHQSPGVQRVTMVEPQPAAAAELAAMKFGCQTKIINKALSDSSRSASFNTGTASASLLDPGSLAAHFPTSVPVGKVEVTCDTLDALVDSGEVSQPDTIKLDVQGGELAVLRGAVKALSRVQAIIVETSWVPLYLGEPPPSDLIGFLYQQGFRVADCSGGLRDRAGLMLQQDLLFLRAT